MSRGSGLGLNGSRRNGSFWRSMCLGGNRCSLTNPLSMTTLFFRYRLGGRGGSFGRNLRCSSSRFCECHIGPIKKALHVYTHGGGDLLGSRAIYGERFRLLLKKKNVKRNINTDVKTKGTINYMW